MRLLRHWGPAIAWAVVIWIFSTGSFTADATSRFIFPMLHWLFPGASSASLVHMHHLIRKSAHVLEYAVLSVLVLRGIRGDERGWRWTWGLAVVAMAACYAALDEVHQAFVPGRGASPWDVLRDTAGASLGQVWGWWRGRKARKPEE